jgi:hypothetical protein
MQIHKDEKLVVDLRKKNQAELVEFLNALLNAKKILGRKGVKLKFFLKNKINSPCISKF